MFNKKQLEIIRLVAKDGLSHKVCASRLGMTYNNFMEDFQDDESAQLAYERGQADLEVEVVTVAKQGLLEGDVKKFEFFTNNVLNIAGKNMNKDTLQNKNKKSIVPSVLLNPNKLLEVSDEELQRKIDLKNMEDNKNVKQIVNNGDNSEQDTI